MDSGGHGPDYPSREASARVQGAAFKDRIRASVGAIFEVCCIPIYLQRQLVPRVRKGRTNAVHMVVVKLGVGGTGAIGDTHVKPLAVDSLISSARAELKAMEAHVPSSDRIDAHELIDI